MSIWRGVTIVPTSTTSCGRRLLLSLRKRGADSADVRPPSSHREARVTNVLPMVERCKSFFAHGERLFLCPLGCLRAVVCQGAHVRPEKWCAEVRCSVTKASNG